MGLTPKQEKFCQEYVRCGNASEAYRLAYNARKMQPKTISRKAYEVLDNGNITAYIETLNAEIESKAIAEAKEVQEWLTKVLRGEVKEECVTSDGVVTKQVTPKDRIKAAETLAKMRGYYNVNLNMVEKPIIIDDI